MNPTQLLKEVNQIKEHLSWMDSLEESTLGTEDRKNRRVLLNCLVSCKEQLSRFGIEA